MQTAAMTGSRILVVDDEDQNVRLVQRCLASAGYRNVRGMVDPRAALTACTEWEPDLVLLDLHMPDLDGMSFLQQLRQEALPAEFLPVLVLTGDTTRDALKNALAAGANDFLTKPFELDEVLLRVHNLLAIRLSHEELKVRNTALAAELRDRTRFEQQQAARREQKIAEINRLLDLGGPSIVFQPIADLSSRRTVGYEALSRFADQRSPDRWFADAAFVGLGVELELSAVSAALSHLVELEPAQFLALNVSPEAMTSELLHQMLDHQRGEQLVLELTEHQPIHDYDALRVTTAHLRAAGIRIAVDDAGAGYASLHHILQLGPDLIKLDMSLTRDIDSDPVKRALTSSLAQFAVHSHAQVVAEGIETADELGTLCDLGIPLGQGYHIARPAALDTSAHVASGE